MAVTTVRNAAAILLAALLATPAAADEPTTKQELVRDGIRMTLAVEAVGGGPLRAHEPARIRFDIADVATGEPLRRVVPGAWIDLQQGGQAALTCREKIRAYTQGGLAFRPVIDLNSWHLVTLNREPTLSVIDPMLGMSQTKTLALVRLDAPGADWVRTIDNNRLFVSLPDAGQVAVIDTVSWKVEARIAVGDRPVRTVLQPDGRLLWVGHEGDAGVTVIDTATLEIRQRIATGAGPHEIAVGNDGSIAVVTNGGAGTATLIDAVTLARLDDVPVGPGALWVAHSPLARSFYVAAQDGVVALPDNGRGKPVTMTADAGIDRLALTPDGRFGFLVNGRGDRVQIFDTSVNRLVHTVPVEGTPDQISFTDAFAYVRARNTDRVTMIHLSGLNAIDAPRVSSFGAGTQPIGPDRSLIARADAIAAAPDGGSVLIAGPQDGQVFYYMEGMSAPSGSFRNFRGAMRAVMAIDRGLRETAPGRYSVTIQFPASGRYDMAVLLGQPRLADCFRIDVQPNGTETVAAEPMPLRLEYEIAGRTLPAGRDVPLRLRLAGDPGNDGWRDARDVRVLAMAPSGNWQARWPARPAGDGQYEATLNLPRDGVYYVYVEAPSLAVSYRTLPHLVLRGSREETP
jgi:YVTN family beta-propeller protein